MLKSASLAALTSLTMSAAMAQGTGDDGTDEIVETWAYKDWKVTRTTTPGPEDTRASCDMRETVRRDLQLMIFQTDGDAGPPDAYPSVMLLKDAEAEDIPSEHTPTTSFIWTFDDQAPETLPMDADVMGAQRIYHAPSAQFQALLAHMAKHNTLTVTADAGSEIGYSLDGFSAAYKKMAEWCAFSTEGVL